MGRVVYERDIGCRPTTRAPCGPVRGAFNTLEECAMACGRLGRMPYSARYQPGSGGKREFRMGPLDFSPPCSIEGWFAQHHANLGIGEQRMASSFNDSYVATRAMAIVASLLTLSCAPPAPVLDVGVDTTPIDDAGTDAS